MTTFTDRYGDNPPDVYTMCLGQCEGTGTVPVHRDEGEEPYRTLWIAAEIEEPTNDGWHFIACPDCNGTGLSENPRVATYYLSRRKEIDEARFKVTHERLMKRNNIVEIGKQYSDDDSPDI